MPCNLVPFAMCSIRAARATRLDVSYDYVTDRAFIRRFNREAGTNSGIFSNLRQLTSQIITTITWKYVICGKEHFAQDNFTSTLTGLEVLSNRKR